MRPLKIGLDVDGVFADFNGRPDLHGFSKVLRDVTGRDLFPPAWTPQQWHWMTALGYRKSEVDQGWAFVDGSHRWWAELHAYVETVPALVDVYNLEYAGLIAPTFLTTRNSPTAHRQTVKWLEEHGYSRPQVCICANCESKGLMAKALALDAVLDDWPENLDAIALHSPQTHRLLLTRPWNLGAGEGDGRTHRRVPTVPQAIAVIKSWLQDAPASALPSAPVPQ